MNTVSVSFSGYRHSAEASAALWQWDYGQKLIIRGLNLPEVYETHFCNQGDAESITIIGDSSGVSIPDELLETGKNIKAYIYLHDGADDGETEYEITIKVNPRAKPSDRLPKESERSIFNEVLALLNSLTGGQNQGSSFNGALNYTALINRPRINGKTLAGDMTGTELGLVNADDGKGLSSNDYTDDEKEKLSQAVTHDDLTDALSSVQSGLSFDDDPTEGSDNPVTSDGVYRAILHLTEEISVLRQALEALQHGVEDEGSHAEILDDYLVLSDDAEIDDDGYLVVPGASVVDDFLNFGESTTDTEIEDDYLMLSSESASIEDDYLTLNASVEDDYICV